VWIAKPGALTIIASVSLTPNPSLFACFYESVSSVYVFFSTCLSACVASAAWFVFCFVFITTFLFPFFFFCKFNRYLCHGALNVRITLLLSMSPFFICMFTLLIPVYVLPKIHTHSLPVLYSYTFIAISICMFCDLRYIYTHLFVFFLRVPKRNRHLCYGVYWCNYTLPNIRILRFLLYFHFVIYTSTIVWYSCLP